MKKLLNILLAFTILTTVSLMASCSKDDENIPDEEQNIIEGFSGSLSVHNGKNIRLTWDDPGKPSYAFYSLYRKEADGEFELRNDRISETHFNDNQTNHETSYQYYVQFQDTKSPVITIETDHRNQPFVSGYAQVTGEGSSASVVHILVNWLIGSNSEVQKYDIFRDGELIHTETRNFETEYRDTDNKVFDQEYNYEVIVHTQSGQQFKSSSFSITPRRPEEVNRPVPEIIRVISSSSTDIIQLIISDVSSNPLDLIEFDAEIESSGFSWSDQVKVSDLAKDEDDNLIISLSKAGADISQDQINWFTVQVRIHTEGGWSNWRYFKSLVF